VILITVSSDTDFHHEASEALAGCISFEAGWRLAYHDTVRLRTADVDEKYVMLIDFADSKRALPVALAVEGRPEFAVIAVGGCSTRDDLLQLMQAGVRDVLSRNSPEEARRVALRAVAKLGSNGQAPGDIYAFVPAKPGCGATTVATYVAAAAARLAAEPPLLLDFDIRLGVTSFLLKAEGNHTIVDALEQAEHLDNDIWSGVVSQCGNLHLVGSGPVDFARPVPVERFGSLLRFAAEKYSLIMVDLPGTMEDYECETLRRAKQIFLVCTPDIGALHVARRKSSWLRDIGVTENVSVILNRVERRSLLPLTGTEDIIQMPVRYVLGTGTAEISRAAQKGVALDAGSSMGKQIEKIASTIVGARSLAKRPSPVRRFAEYFSISAARDARTS